VWGSLGGRGAWRRLWRGGSAGPGFGHGAWGKPAQVDRGRPQRQRRAPLQRRAARDRAGGSDPSWLPTRRALLRPRRAGVWAHQLLPARLPAVARQDAAHQLVHVSLQAGPRPRGKLKACRRRVRLRRRPLPQGQGGDCGDAGAVGALAARPQMLRAVQALGEKVQVRETLGGLGSLLLLPAGGQKEAEGRMRRRGWPVPLHPG
jgi:hypothetical protein